MWPHKRLEEAEPDVLREMVKSFAEAPMSAEADALCGATFRQCSGERVDRRNGYRERPFDTRTSSYCLDVVGSADCSGRGYLDTKVSYAATP